MNSKGVMLTCTLLLSQMFIACDFGTEPSGNLEFNTGLVTTEWLSKNVTQEDIVIIDVRSAAEFANGMIPNSINIPFDLTSTWTISKDSGLWVELPVLTELSAKLGENGITGESKVVLVTSLPTAGNPFSLASPTRVALTLAYAGFTEVAILDGGFDKWAAEEKTVSTTAKVITPAVFTAKEDNSLFVTIDYVTANLNKIPLVDARDAVVYAGSVIEPWAAKAGHIPGALSLPAPALWNTDGTYKTKTEIETIVKGVAGDDRNKEIIVYCGVGGYASAVWFAMTQILDYKNVKVYDGSSQEWVLSHDMETTAAQ
ncbi:MAG: sulfurtransferase [Chitinispirillaceae bacterium]|nr:sulfurtransferase [Chitinispirillaceae bacterium]